MSSKKQVKKAGNRIAEGDLSTRNLELVEEYRATYDELLIQTSERINRVLRESTIKFLLSGRPKRMKSIIRKLIRERDSKMDVTRMADLVGLRILVSSIEEQDDVVGRLVLEFGAENVRTRDYRTRDSGYRAVHLIYKGLHKYLEIQVRTIVQHLWAVESEVFGEQVKEGGGELEIREYLDQLSAQCLGIELNVPTDEGIVGTIFSRRAAISLFLPSLDKLFRLATEGFGGSGSDTAYIIVFDSRLATLTSIRVFFADERELALREYRSLGKRLDQERFDVVIVNSRTRSAIAVTHPNYFPKVRYGRFE